MEICAIVRNSGALHEAHVRTGAVTQSLAISSRTAGSGSAVSGGEFLMLALATCYCNDLYREAERLRVPLNGVEVVASAQFPGVGLAATDIRYRAKVSSPASAAAISQLLRKTDAVAEVHNTIRAGASVELATD